MRPMGVGIGLVFWILGWTSQADAPAFAAPTGEHPRWQQQMERARRIAAGDYNYVLAIRPLRDEARGTSGICVFYNNPHPFCYTYMIPGDWVAAREPNAYRSRDGRAFAGVQFWPPRDLEGMQGETLVERAKNFITQVHERALKQRMTGVELMPFESARPGT